MQYDWHDVVGNVGVLLVLGTYVLLQLNRLRSESLTYSIVNAAGAGLILISLSMEFNMSAFLIEAAWLIVSIMGVGLYFLRAKRNPTAPITEISKQ